MLATYVLNAPCPSARPPAQVSVSMSCGDEGHPSSGARGYDERGVAFGASHLTAAASAVSPRWQSCGQVLRQGGDEAKAMMLDLQEMSGGCARLAVFLRV